MSTCCVLQVLFLWGLPFTVALLSILLRRLSTPEAKGNPEAVRAVSKEQSWLASTKYLVSLGPDQGRSHRACLRQPDASR